MRREKIINFDSFEDFLTKMRDKELLYCGGLKPSFDLAVSDCYYYSFGRYYSKAKLDEDIRVNSELFESKPTDNFYYPNTNMFSGDNSMYNIKGFILKIKKDGVIL